MILSVDDLLTEERLSKELLDAILFIRGHVEWTGGRGGRRRWLTHCAFMGQIICSRKFALFRIDADTESVCAFSDCLDLSDTSNILKF